VTPGKITVEVALAGPKLQTVRRILLPEGSTVADALAASGLQAEPGRVGVYGKVVPPRTILREGDRVEIYRPLLADPKELRRDRAAGSRAKR
jgi:uncharacterized protein